MANQLLIDHFRCLVAAAKAKARTVEGVTHLGLRGRFREILAEDLLRPVLPVGGGIGTGKIVDWQGGQSQECDLVIYHRDVLPPVLYEPRSGLFPVEACLYNIEVKSKLCASGVNDTIVKFRHLRRTLQVQVSGAGPVNVLFAFDSDLSENGKSELDRYLADDVNAATDPAVDVICVMGKGYWHFQRAQSGQGTWWHFQATADNQEIVDFIGGVANTIASRMTSPLRVSFGRYIVEGRGQVISVPGNIVSAAAR